MLALTIDTTNAAFADDPAEVARILREYAEQVARRGGPFTTKLRDVNGNTVGAVTVTA